MYPIKLYNGNSVLIYQVDNGSGNKGMQPSGGVLFSSTAASSMSAVVANPITFYHGSPHTVISQVGQSGDLYNYYWTSYSRGVDGANGKPQWHNLYLDSYILLRYKSIYDPCPYGYRIPSNGTYNEFINPGWIAFSYAVGLNWKQSWLCSAGNKSDFFLQVGIIMWYNVSTPFNNIYLPTVTIYENKKISYFGGDSHERTRGVTVRCIEECELLASAEK